jgi:hypothetical protein
MSQEDAPKNQTDYKRVRSKLPMNPDQIARDGLDPLSEEEADLEVACITKQERCFTAGAKNSLASKEARRKRLLKKEEEDYKLAVKLSKQDSDNDSESDAGAAPGANIPKSEETPASQVRDNSIVWEADEYGAAVTVEDIKETLRKMHEIMGTKSSIDIASRPHNDLATDLTGDGAFHDEYWDFT